jgi:hypothetical protein
MVVMTITFGKVVKDVFFICLCTMWNQEGNQNVHIPCPVLMHDKTVLSSDIYEGLKFLTLP